MPSAFARQCRGRPGCKALITKGRMCAACAGVATVQRGSPSSRGYDHRWRRYSEDFRMEFPLCGDGPVPARAATNSQCKAKGRTTAAKVVDHIDPITGPDDPRFWDRENHGSLCDSCHQVKRQKEVKRR